jgi:hypothetical protein
MKNILSPDIFNELKQKCKNMVKDHINYIIKNQFQEDCIWMNEYFYIDSISIYINRIRLELESDFEIYIHDSFNNALYFKVVPSNLIEKINFNDKSFKFDGYIYYESNKEMQKSTFKSILEGILYKELEHIKTEKFYDDELLLFSHY